MEITRKSMISGKTRTIDLPITEDQITSYKGGTLVQYAFPHLSDADREFFISGITDDEWNEAFPDDDDEDDFASMTEAAPYANLAEAARSIAAGQMGYFYAVHCDPLYNAGEQSGPRLFDIIRNDDTALVVRRQYRNAELDLTEYREGRPS